MHLPSLSAVAFIAVILDLTTVVRSASTCQQPVACLSGQIGSAAEVVIDALNSITQISQVLEDLASQMSATSSSGINAINTVAEGLANITSAVSREVSVLGSSQPFNATCDEAAISNALSQFVQVHRALLNIVIGKSGLIDTVPLAGPSVAAALRALEGVVDSLATGIISLIPTDACYVENELSSLSEMLQNATAVYA